MTPPPNADTGGHTLGNITAKSIYDEDGYQVDLEITQADDEVEISLPLLANLDRRFCSVTIRVGSR